MAREPSNSRATIAVCDEKSVNFNTTQKIQRVAQNLLSAAPIVKSDRKLITVVARASHRRSRCFSIDILQVASFAINQRAGIIGSIRIGTGCYTGILKVGDVGRWQGVLPWRDPGESPEVGGIDPKLGV
jgi:hypothetical protein